MSDADTQKILAGFDRKNSNQTTEDTGDLRVLLKEKVKQLIEKEHQGSIKITVERAEKDPIITENVNEFILISRNGARVEIDASSSKLFSLAAIAAIKKLF